MRILLTIIVIFLLLIPSSLSANESLSAKQSLVLAEEDMQEMINQGIPITRYNDTFFMAKQIYYSQLALERSGEKSDYVLFNQKMEELRQIKYNAFKALDELKALELAINKTENIDLEPVLALYAQAEQEFRSERYEECLKVIDKTYQKISELEAVQTKVKALYEATSRNIIDFLKREWKQITIIIISLAAISKITHKPIMKKLIEKRIQGLEMRKQSVTKLIQDAQRDYFEHDMGETTYRTKIKKYGELIRDMERQIPLLKEELAMMNKKDIKEKV
jgi:hypothetical protein